MPTTTTIREHVPLAPLTTLGIGGPARYFTAAHTDDDLRAALNWAAERSLPVFVLGGGSNLVVSDTGFAGLVVKNEIAGLQLRREGEFDIFTAGGGVDWNEFVAATLEANCAGVECLNGIPGTVGATPVQNVGAYGQDVSQTIRRVRCIDRQTGATIELTSEECGFAYRTSRFNTADRDRYIITRVEFALRHNGTPTLNYADLQRAFADRPAPTLTEVADVVWRIRREKAMVITDDEPDSRSAGSFFKNPHIPQERFELLRRRAEERDLTLPSFAGEQGRVKVPAAWLIEHSGLHRGFELGRVAISRRHTLALVNRGGATAAELIALKELVQQRVREAFGIELQPEPVFLGFDLADSRP